MTKEELLRSITYSIPLFCALFCIVLMLLDAFMFNKKKEDKRLRLFLAGIYLVGAICWQGLIFEITAPGIFVWYRSVFLLTLMLSQVLIYCFVHKIMSTGDEYKFCRLHFAIPLFITAIFITALITVPIEEQLSVIYGGSNASSWYNVLHASTGVITLVYSLLYPLLGLARIRRYKRRIVDYSADIQYASLGWLTAVPGLMLTSVPVSLFGVLLGVDPFKGSVFTWLGAVPIFIVYLILCYNILSDNYLIIPPEVKEDEPQPAKSSIDRRQFENYMREQKPYLNPKLKITELAADINTNRSYLSSFINKEYGVNFSRYINRQRLEELDRLRTSPQSREYTNMELVFMAGFSSYRSYLRVKDEEDRSKILKVFE